MELKKIIYICIVIFLVIISVGLIYNNLTIENDNTKNTTKIDNNINNKTHNNNISNEKKSGINKPVNKIKSKLSQPEAVSIAKKYLNSHGWKNLKITSVKFYSKNGIWDINFINTKTNEKIGTYVSDKNGDIATG